MCAPWEVASGLSGVRCRSFPALIYFTKFDGGWCKGCREFNGHRPTCRLVDFGLPDLVS